MNTINDTVETIKESSQDQTNTAKNILKDTVQMREFMKRLKECTAELSAEVAFRKRRHYQSGGEDHEGGGDDEFPKDAFGAYCSVDGNGKKSRRGQLHTCLWTRQDRKGDEQVSGVA